MKFINKIYISVIIVLCIGLGFFRDSFFKHLNAQLYYTQNKLNEKLESEFYRNLFLNFSAKELYYGKWIFTIVFTALFLFITIVLIKLLFNTNKYTKFILLFYGSIIILSAICFSFGWLTNNFAEGYRFARILMGAVQSPFILLMLVPSIKLFDKSDTTKLT